LLRHLSNCCWSKISPKTHNTFITSLQYRDIIIEHTRDMNRAFPAKNITLKPTLDFLHNSLTTFLGIAKPNNVFRVILCYIRSAIVALMSTWFYSTAQLQHCTCLHRLVGSILADMHDCKQSAVSLKEFNLQLS